MSFKPTREYMLTPRDCTHCGQHMSAELLAKRRFKRAERISASLKEYTRKKSVEQSDTTKELNLISGNCGKVSTSLDL